MCMPEKARSVNQQQARPLRIINPNEFFAQLPFTRNSIRCSQFQIYTGGKHELTHALVGLVALGGTALGVGTASAMPIGLAAAADQVSNIEQVRWVCGPRGRCWNAPGYAYYGGPVYGPRYGYRWHRGWYGRRW
jgi:hypothetical protein